MGNTTGRTSLGEEWEEEGGRRLRDSGQNWAARAGSLQAAAVAPPVTQGDNTESYACGDMHQNKATYIVVLRGTHRGHKPVI